MIIQLCEDDGFLYDGNPKLVVLLIQTDDGKTHRIPYPANQTITQLYNDVRKIGARNTRQLTAAPVTPEQFKKTLDAIQNLATEDAVKQTQRPSGPEDVAPTGQAGVIEREDIVECVAIKKDLDGNAIERDAPVNVGSEYRVIAIIRNRERAVLAYEVLDDVSDNKIRIPMFPEEVRLKRKFTPGPKRRMIFEERYPCQNCAEENALRLNEQGTRYEGACSKCGASMVYDRPTTKTGEPA